MLAIAPLPKPRRHVSFRIALMGVNGDAALDFGRMTNVSNMPLGHENRGNASRDLKARFGSGIREPAVCGGHKVE